MKELILRDKVVSQVISHFVTSLGEVKEIDHIDNQITIIRFKSSDVLTAKVCLIGNLQEGNRVPYNTLTVDIVLNGKRVFSDKYEGDEVILLRMCENLVYIMMGIMGGNKNERVGNGA